MSDSEIEQTVQELTARPAGPSLLDGLLLGAVIGAAGAALLVLGRVIATRRIARRLAPNRPGAFTEGNRASPL